MIHFAKITDGEKQYMATMKPRINVVLEPLLYEKVRFLAEKDGVSLSTKVRDLIQESIEVNEDISLADFAKERDKIFQKSKALSHDEVWS